MAEDGIRIDELDPEVAPTLQHMFPAMFNNKTVHLTAQQMSDMIISIIRDGAPAAIDTLNELAAALGDDPNYAATIATALNMRLRIDAAQALNATQKTRALNNLGISPYIQGLLPLTTEAAFRGAIKTDILSGMRNKLRNGDFSIRQRGTSWNLPAGGSTWTADGWLVRNSTDVPVTININRYTSTYNNNHVPGWSRDRMHLVFATAPTSGNVNISQAIEGVETLAGEEVTATVYVRGPESAANEAINGQLVQKFGSGGSPSPNTNTNVPLSPGVAYQSGALKNTGKATVPSIGTSTIGTNGDDRLIFRLYVSARSAGTYILSRASLVKGDATGETDPFSPRDPAVEMALCQRWFQKTYPKDIVPAHIAGSMAGAINALMNGFGYTIGSWDFAVPMRSLPTLTFYTPGPNNHDPGIWVNHAGTSGVIVANIYNTERGVTVTTGTVSSLAGHFVGIHATADAELGA